MIEPAEVERLAGAGKNIEAAVEHTQCPDERHNGVSQSLMLFRCYDLCNCGLQNTNIAVQETAKSSGNDDSLEITSETEDEHAYASACKTD